MENYRADLVAAGLPFINKAKFVHDFDPRIVQKIPRAISLSELGEMAIEMIDARGEDFAYVSGRLRTGGQGFVQNAINMDIDCDWLAAGEHLHQTPIFYQLVFQTEIHRIREELYPTDSTGFIEDLCDNFCRPVLHHKFLNAFIKLPKSHLSEGAERELRIFKARPDARGIPIRSIEKLRAEVFQDFV